MIKRPKRGETEEDILRMQDEFLAQQAKDPKLKPAAEVVKPNPEPKKSLFAKKRGKQQSDKGSISDRSSTSEKSSSSAVENIVLGEVYERIIGKIEEQAAPSTLVLGDVVEKSVTAPKEQVDEAKKVCFPKVEKADFKLSPKAGRSIFSLSMEAKSAIARTSAKESGRKRQMQAESMECEPVEKCSLNAIYGDASAIVDDEKTGVDVHKENLELLSKMKEEEIWAERQKLLDTLDPSLVAFLAKKRGEKLGESEASSKIEKTEKVTTDIDSNAQAMETGASSAEYSAYLPASNSAVDILQRSSAEHWVNFDVVETDKLEWMRDIPAQQAKLKPGEKFEARFDWKGVLLPYNIDDKSSDNGKEKGKTKKDERELYLHGDEPHRPGYTLQELFRLARSNVIQQRVSAYGAICGILNIYNQGFYDGVLDLPISKIFFLLRFGLDDNTPAILEVVSKALAFLFYNETDETLLDLIFDNPGCHWQPTLQVLQTDSDVDDPTSIENLQQQLTHLKMNDASNFGTAAYKANVDETEEESKTSMSDFQLAETDLIECFLRTNILQRIYFILKSICPENSTVTSCLKILIRLGRSGKDVAIQIANHDDLINCLIKEFLPGLEGVDTFAEANIFYKFPQYLCLKLIRVLISQNLGIAVKFLNLRIVDILQNYIFSHDDIKSKLVKVQIESLRIVRCLLLLRVDNTLYRKFLPAFRYMLEWHYNHNSFDVGGAFLLRQHAGALLAAIASGGLSGSGAYLTEVHTVLGDLLHDCCCNWFYKASQQDGGIKEFSQATLLSGCLAAVTWLTRLGDGQRFRSFNEKFLKKFITSKSFEQFVANLPATSIVLRNRNDRRNIHPPLPNVGAIRMQDNGPELVVPQTYPAHLLTTLWRLFELQLEQGDKVLLTVLIRPEVVEPLVKFLQMLSMVSNRYLATNFFAKAELRLTFQLLCFEGFHEFFKKSEMLHIVYNYLCFLTAEYIPEIEELFQRVIFNKKYIDVHEVTLKRWNTACLDLVHEHYIVVSPTELTLSVPFSQPPILTSDWPYFQLKHILLNYIENAQHKRSIKFEEIDVIKMTLNFVSALEDCNPKMEIVTPTEKLMYFMICFMGPDLEFLNMNVRDLLRNNLRRFYKQCSKQDCTFQFDAQYADKCKFENLYALFVDHFQAASYGDELFGSLVMVPLAQKYDNKWRRRIWSDYGSVLRFLDSEEKMLIGGLKAYLEPPEEEESLIRAYAVALNSNLVRQNSIPYKIAKHHVTKYKERMKNK